MIPDPLRTLVLRHVDPASWPEIESAVDRAVHVEDQSIWEYPTAACLAVGGQKEQALPGAAAILCSVLGIHLIDDMLDADEQGAHRHLGKEATANLAMAFHAMAHAVLSGTKLGGERKALVHERLASTLLATLTGQHSETQLAPSEDGYWSVVEAKTVPLLSCGLCIGSILGGAPQAVAEKIADLGHWMGRTLQVCDDLGGALRCSATEDWRRPQVNLALLYGMTVEHPERREFRNLLQQIDEAEALQAAQDILLRCGAVSYCLFKIAELSRIAASYISHLAVATLTDPGPLQRLLRKQIQPVDDLFLALDIPWRPLS